MARDHQARGRRRSWRAGLAAGAVAVVAVIVAAGWVAYDAVAARASLTEAAAAIPQLEERLRTDPDAAQRDLAELQAVTGDAARRTGGPLFRLAAYAPVLGDDVRALTTIAATVDGLATDVLPRLSAAALAVTPESLAPRDGRVDLAGLEAVRADVVAADRAVGAAIERIGAVERAGLVDALADAADQVQGRLVRVRLTTATAARVVELLPPMLGADGPREWLVLAQNNAEPRATGGIPGAMLLLRADGGAAELAGSVSTTELGDFAVPVLPLTDVEQAMFGDGLGRWVQDVNFTPDFPRSAVLATEMWRRRQGGEPAGVLSIDPVALQELVGATGPVSFEDPSGDTITLTQDDTAEFLLSTIYARYADPNAQDAVFALAAEAVFAALTSGGVDAALAVDALATSASQGRLMVWSADDAEQERLAGTVLSGELRGTRPTVDGEVSPVVGAFLNMTTAGKLGFYLDAAYDVEAVVPRADGSRELTLRVRLANVLAPEEVAGLPAYVTGNTPGQGAIRANLLVYAPANGAIKNVTSVTGDPVEVHPQVHDGLPAATLAVGVEPGATLDLRFEIVSGMDQWGDVVLRATPGIVRP